MTQTSAAEPLGVPSSRPPSSPRLARLAVLIGVGVALALFATLMHDCWGRAYPPLPRQIRLLVTFPNAPAGANEPLISTGVFGAGDFLSVKYADAGTATLSYDTWGTGGPASAPFAVRPGEKHILDIAMPSASHVGPVRVGQKGRLRVMLDGREVLHSAVSFHARQPNQVYFGLNPIGGTPAPSFDGVITTARGQVLHGRPAVLFSWRQRWQVMLAGSWEWLVLLLVSAGVGYAAARLTRLVPRLWAAKPPRPAVMRNPAHLTFAVVTLVVLGLFTTLITGGTFRLLYPESFGNFYDYQALSLMHGRLDVPRQAISGEAFVVRGKSYGYFGVTPALLRLPFVAAHLGFGELSRSFMIAELAACLVATYLLLCEATRLGYGRDARPSRLAVILLVGSAGAGSTLFFLGARAYIYHEAILCGAAFALWAAYLTLRYVAEPDSRWWIGSLACGFLAVHARPPAGLFALFLLGCAAVYRAAGSWRRRAGAGVRRHLGIGILALLAVLTFNGLSYLKFRTFDGSPLRYSVQYSPERLARFGGKNFHLVNLRHNFDTYVVNAGCHLAWHFPWVRFGSHEPHSYPEAKLDMTEPTVAFPYAMPALFALTVIGGLWALFRAPGLRPAVILLSIGVAPMALALFMAIVTSHRYTGDFCPYLIAMAACGMAAFDAEPRRRRAALLGVTAVLTVASIVVTALLSLEFQGKMVWGTQPAAVRHYQELRTEANRLIGDHRS